MTCRDHWNVRNKTKNIREHPVRTTVVQWLSGWIKCKCKKGNCSTPSSSSVDSVFRLVAIDWRTSNSAFQVTKTKGKFIWFHCKLLLDLRLIMNKPFYFIALFLQITGNTMRQPFLLLFLGLLMAVSVTSAGKQKRHSRIKSATPIRWHCACIPPHRTKGTNPADTESHNVILAWFEGRK